MSRTLYELLIYSAKTRHWMPLKLTKGKAKVT